MLHLQKSTHNCILPPDLISPPLPSTDIYLVRSHPFCTPASQPSEAAAPETCTGQKCCMKRHLQTHRVRNTAWWMPFAPGTIDDVVKIFAPFCSSCQAKKGQSDSTGWPVCMYYRLPGFPPWRSEEHAIPDCKTITPDFLGCFRSSTINLSTVFPHSKSARDGYAPKASGPNQCRRTMAKLSLAESEGSLQLSMLSRSPFLSMPQSNAD